MSTWYLVLTKIRQEELARENLERQGFRAYLPMFRTSKLRRGKRVDAAELLFPRHVFVELDLETQDVSLIRSTYGAIGLVQYGAEPARLPTGFVETLIDLEHQQATSDPQDTEPKAEPASSIGSGLFPVTQAIFNAPDGKQRVLLLMEIISTLKH
ncbi:transcriptional activator RfaH [Thiohalocapsa marina]|uniref:transcriptional activator RfaH n=1 Tax=Thiohalocapsa marina TaxID=424902 RepID=UPI0036D7D96C